MISRKIQGPAFIILSLAMFMSCGDGGDGMVGIEGKIRNNATAQDLYLDLVEAGASELKTLDTVRAAKGTADFRLTGVALGKDDLYRIRLGNSGQYVLLVADRSDLRITLDAAAPAQLQRAGRKIV